MGRARPDVNSQFTIIGASSVDEATPIEIWVNPTTHAILTQATISGTVTVSATDLDIRDLVAASDSVTVHGSVGALQQAIGGDLKVTLDSESVAVTGTFWQATQPVSGTFWQATQPISAASLPLPTGAATSANQSTEITALQLIDDSVFAEDTPAVAADKGIALLAVRRDADTSLVDTDADYANLQVNALGALKVEIFDGGDSHTVDGTFWQATQPVSIAAIVNVDVSDEATRLLGVVYGSQGAQLQQKITSNDLIVTLDGESVAVTGTFWQATQPVSGTFWQATQPVSAASLPLPTGASTSALQGGGLPAALAAGGGLKVEGVAGGVAQPVSGTFWQATQPVSGTFWQATQPVSGTFWQATQPVSATDLDIRDLTATDIVSAIAAGNVAHDAIDSGNPLKIGGKAETSPAGITLVVDGDRTDLYADSDGLQMTKPFTSYGDILSERVSNTDGASTALATFGATAGTKNFITTIIVHNSHATTNCYVDIRDGTAGAVLMTIPAPANGGAVINLPLPLKQPTANTALAFDVSAAVSTIYLSFVGFKSKVA